MAWTYLAVSEDSLSPWRHGSDRLPTAKTIDTPKPFCSHDSLTDRCLVVPSGMTCVRCLGITYHRLISSTVDFLAKTEILRLTREVRPTFVFLENVPAIRTRGGQQVVTELAYLGYDTRWDVLSAYDVGAPHKRDRWFLLANGNGNGCQEQPKCDSQGQKSGGALRYDVDGFCDIIPDAGRNQLWDEQGGRSGQSRLGQAEPRNDGPEESLANAISTGLEIQRQQSPWEKLSTIKRSSAFDIDPVGNGTFWSVGPDVGRVAHGIPKRVDRLRGLGNAVVPAQAREAFRRLMGL